MMSAYDAMVAILDINETVEALKNKNKGNIMDYDLCLAVRLLTSYRDFLVDIMKKSTIIGGESDGDKRPKETDN